MPLTLRLLKDYCYTYEKVLADQVFLNICSNILTIALTEIFAKRNYAKRKYSYTQSE